MKQAKIAFCAILACPSVRRRNPRSGPPVKQTNVDRWITKPRPHQQQCRSNIAECYKSNDFFDKLECCFDIVAGVDGALYINKIVHFASSRSTTSAPAALLSVIIIISIKNVLI